MGTNGNGNGNGHGNVSFPAELFKSKKDADKERTLAIVALLESALEDAKANKLKALAICGVSDEGDPLSGYRAGSGEYLELFGAVEILKGEIIGRILIIPPEKEKG